MIAENGVGRVRRNIRPSVIVLGICLLLNSMIYAQTIQQGGGGFVTADWLINYQGGITRRGLLGEVLFGVSLTGIPILWLTYALQVGVSVGVTWLVIRLFYRKQRETVWYALLLSPAFLLAPFFDRGMAFRKETLAFLAFAILADAVAARRRTQGALGAAWVIFAIAAFAHEATAFTLPFFLYLIGKGYASGSIQKTAATRWMSTFGITALAGAIFALMFPGGERVADGVCQSLLNRGLSSQLCAGAVQWLRFDTQYGMKATARFAGDYLRVYPMLLGVAMAPALLVQRADPWRTRLWVVGLLALLPLFLVAVDWGRWIGMYVFFIFTSLLAEDTMDTVKLRPIPLLWIAAYLTTWSIPHCCAEAPRFGMMQLLVRGWPL